MRISTFFTASASVILSIALVTACGKKNEAPIHADGLPTPTFHFPTFPTNTQSSKNTSVSLMEFNVENMFDNVHDEGTNDETYLPKAVKDASPDIQAKCSLEIESYYKNECLNLDWNDQVVDTKIKNVAGTILSVEAGRGADILLMEEVENINILSQLRDKYLPAAGYKTTVLIEGFDTRGIDVALMSRLPLNGQPQLHKIPLVAQTPEDQAGMDVTRGILEVPLKLPDGSAMTVFVVHFPSQSHPQYWRDQAMAYLVTLINQHQNELVVAGGDFNLPKSEDDVSHGFSQVLSSVADVTHLVGCKACQGSYYYKKQFDFIDAMAFGGLFKSSNPSWKLDTTSIDVANKNPNHVNPKTNAPLRFDPVNGVGVSDHFPMFARIVQQSGANQGH